MDVGVAAVGGPSSGITAGSLDFVGVAMWFDGAPPAPPAETFEPDPTKLPIEKLADCDAGGAVWRPATGDGTAVPATLTWGSADTSFGLVAGVEAPNGQPQNVEVHVLAKLDTAHAMVDGREMPVHLPACKKDGQRYGYVKGTMVTTPNTTSVFAQFRSSSFLPTQVSCASTNDEWKYTDCDGHKAGDIIGVIRLQTVQLSDKP